VKTEGSIQDLPAVWMEGSDVVMIEQRKLPGVFELLRATTTDEVALSIRDMAVRGAPSIGATAAYGMAQAQMLGEDLDTAAEKLKATRPTAFDLFYAVDLMQKLARTGGDLAEASRSYADNLTARCRRIGEHGEKLIRDGARILTHCNAGALATLDHGTALAPIREAHARGKGIFVFADETRPRMQGARLTVWELMQEDIPHALIADNAAGHFMQRGEIDMVITGADRVTLAGDAANKIGTYEKAVLARENAIPFYVAVPVSTIDFSMEDWRDIPIEERGEDEVLSVWGKRLSPEGARARNPAFDVTPAKYITGIITEEGVFKPEEIGGLKDRLGTL